MLAPVTRRSNWIETVPIRSTLSYIKKEFRMRVYEDNILDFGLLMRYLSVAFWCSVFVMNHDRALEWTPPKF